MPPRRRIEPSVTILRDFVHHAVRRPFTPRLAQRLLEIRALSAAIRSANQGCCTLHSCGSSSRSTAASWVLDAGHVADRLAWSRSPARAAPTPPPRRTPGRARAVRPRPRSGTRVRPRSASAPSSTWPNTTAAIAACRPTDAQLHPRVTAARVQTDLQEPRVEPGARRRDPHVAAERQVHARPHRRAVHRGECRERAAGDAQEALVDVRRGSRGSRSAGCPGRRRRRTPLPAPVTTTAPTPSSASNASIAATMDDTIAAVSVLRSPGLLSVNQPTPSRTSVITSGSALHPAILAVAVRSPG